MKLQAVMDREAAKEGTDLLDIIRIVLDGDCGPLALDQLQGADPQLRTDALRHARRWFDERVDLSLRNIAPYLQAQTSRPRTSASSVTC